MKLRRNASIVAHIKRKWLGLKTYMLAQVGPKLKNPEMESAGPLVEPNQNPFPELVMVIVEQQDED